LGKVSLGKMIARDKKHDLIQLTPSQRDEYYALDDQIQIATPIKGRATNQDLENLHTDDAVATRPLPTAIGLDFMADDDTYNDDQTLPLSARKDPAPRASPRVSDYLSDSEGMSTLEEIANTQIINRSQTLSAASTQPSTAQAAAEPGPPADASAGYGRQSLDDGTSQSDRQEACSSQSIHGERVNSQKVSPVAEDKGKGKAEEGQDTYGEGGSSGRGGVRGEGKCRHGEQRGECRECRGEGEAAGGIAGVTGRRQRERQRRRRSRGKVEAQYGCKVGEKRVGARAKRERRESERGTDNPGACFLRTRLQHRYGQWVSERRRRFASLFAIASRGVRNKTNGHYRSETRPDDEGQDDVVNGAAEETEVLFLFFCTKVHISASGVRCVGLH
jgi:hypothetical protein